MADVTTTLTTCWKITREDATVQGYTDHNKGLTVSAQLYKASVGYVPSAIRATADLAVDNMEVMGILSDADIKEADLLAGLYDFAKVEVFTVDWDNVAGGIVQRLITGRLGGVTVEDGQYKAELFGLSQQMQKGIGEVYAAACQADLGDSRCGIELLPADWVADTDYALGDEVSASSYDARRYVATVPGTSNDTEGEPTWDTTTGNTTTEVESTVWAATTVYALGKAVRPTVDNGYAYECTTPGTSGGSQPTWPTNVGATEADGTVVWTCRAYVEWTCADARTKNFTVTGVTDTRIFTDSARTEANAEFDGGLVTWLTGNNAGYTMDCKKYTLTSPTTTIELHEPMPFTIQVGDTGTITQGCDKSATTCKNTFSNLVNFRGFPHVPGQQKLLQGP